MKEQNNMIMNFGLIILFIIIGVANYYLTKSFWCHEGCGVRMCMNNDNKNNIKWSFSNHKNPGINQGFVRSNELTFRELRTFTSFT